MTTDRRPLGNILVAVDLSAASAAVAERAARLPVTPGSSITLFHVVSQEVGRHPVLDAAVREDAQRALGESAEGVAALPRNGMAPPSPGFWSTSVTTLQAGT
jgi:nucleotide-binding universal stress UspA family protein